MAWITGCATDDEIKTLRRKGVKVQKIKEKLEKEIRDVYFEGFEDEIGCEKPNVMIYVKQDIISIATIFAKTKKDYELYCKKNPYATAFDFLKNYD